jgi:hypothetical protein
MLVIEESRLRTTLASTVFVEIGLLGKKEAISAKLSRVLLFFMLGSRRFSRSPHIGLVEANLRSLLPTIRHLGAYTFSAG